MNGFNRVFIMGRLGAKPELQASKNGKPYVRLSIATHYGKKLDSGERQETTTWHRVTVWGKNAERCQNYLAKGSPLAIEGYLSKYSYAREDGTDAKTMSVVAREVHFIGGRNLSPMTDIFVSPVSVADDASGATMEDRTDGTTEDVIASLA